MILFTSFLDHWLVCKKYGTSTASSELWKPRACSWWKSLIEHRSEHELGSSVGGSQRYLKNTHVNWPCDPKSNRRLREHKTKAWLLPHGYRHNCNLSTVHQIEGGFQCVCVYRKQTCCLSGDQMTLDRSCLRFGDSTMKILDCILSGECGCFNPKYIPTTGLPRKLSTM